MPIQKKTDAKKPAKSNAILSVRSSKPLSRKNKNDITIASKSKDGNAAVKPHFTTDIDMFNVPVSKRLKMEKHDTGKSVTRPTIIESEHRYSKVVSIDRKNKERTVTEINAESARTLAIRKKVAGFDNDNSPTAIKSHLGINMTPLTFKNRDQQTKRPGSQNKPKKSK